MKFTEEQWTAIIRSVSGIKEVFTDRDVEDLGKWVHRAKVRAVIADMILAGKLDACVADDGDLVLRKKEANEVLCA